MNIDYIKHWLKYFIEFMYNKKCTTKKIYVQQNAYDNTEERRG